MTDTGGVSGKMLRQYVERVERLHDEKKQTEDDIKEVYAEAKANGFDPKVMRQIIKDRAKDPHERKEWEALLETYRRAVGME